MAEIEEGEVAEGLQEVAEAEEPHPLLAEGPHPLHSSWVLFFDGALQTGGRSAAKEWAKSMKRVAEFSTLEDFWGVVNNIPPPSKLPVGTNYHLFRHGIMPMWEDGNNAEGGKWVFQEKRSGGMSCKNLDNMWLYTMMSLVGENYSDENQICGGVCQLRGKQDRIALWTRDAADQDKYNPIGVIFRKALNDSIADSGTKAITERDLDYQMHDESLKKFVAGGKRR